MSSVKDQVKGNHFDKFCKKVILVNRGGNAYNMSNLGLPGNIFSTTVTFDGDTGTGNPGDHDYGTTNPITLANITGIVAVNVIGYVSSTLVSATTAALKVGVDSDDDEFMTLASSNKLDIGRFWYAGATTTILGSTALLGAAKWITEDIKLEATTANTRSGSIKFYIYWEPLSNDANVER